MPTVHFVKHGVSRPLYINKRQIPFIDAGDDTGLLELDTGAHPDLIAHLTKISGTLGIMKVTSTEADEVKKKCSELQRGKLLRTQQSRQPFRIENSVQGLKPVRAAGTESEPLEIPDSIPAPVKPRKARSKAIATGDLAPQPQAAAPVEAVAE